MEAGREVCACRLNEKFRNICKVEKYDAEL
jgi:hypothetical protein